MMSVHEVDLTCLQFAIMNNRFETVNLLVDAGVSATDTDDARSMLALCTSNDSVKMLDCLFKNGVLDSLKFEDVACSMHLMASNGSHELLRICLEHAVENEADIARLLAHTDPDGKTLLLNAVTSQDPVNVLTVKMLVEHGANVLQTDPRGQTAVDLVKCKPGASNQQVIAILEGSIEIL